MTATPSTPTPDTLAAPLSFRQTLLAMLGLCGVLILVALDQTIVSTALPTVVAELHGFDLYAWVGTSYLLTSIMVLPIFGKLGDEHGRKPFVLAAVALFTLASMLCGVAQNMLQLVLARGLQGVGGGMLMATTFASVPDLFPDPVRRLRWQILFSTSFGLANAIAPSLGGHLTEHWGWRSVFYVNLPVGVLSLLLVSRYLPHLRHGRHAPAPLDWAGSLLIALALGSLQLLMEWWPQHKPLAWLLGLGLLSAGAASLLLWWEQRCPHPVLPLRLLADRQLAPLFSLSLSVGLCMFAVMYYAPLMFQGGFGLSPKQAGWLITPFAVSITVGSIANGRIVTRMSRPNVMLYLGAALFVVAPLTLAQTTIDTPHGMVTAAMVAGGLGIGLLLPNLTLFTQSMAPRAQLGVATAMLQTTRTIGGMLGMAALGALIQRQYTAGIADALSSSVPTPWQHALSDPQVLVSTHDLTQLGIRVKTAGYDLGPWVTQARQVMVSALHDGQWLVSGLMLGVAWLVWRVPPLRLDQDDTPSTPANAPD